MSIVGCRTWRGEGGGEIELVYWSWILRDAGGGNVDSLLGGRVVCNSLTEESPGGWLGRRRLESDWIRDQVVLASRMCHTLVMSSITPAGAIMVYHHIGRPSR